MRFVRAVVGSGLTPCDGSSPRTGSQGKRSKGGAKDQGHAAKSSFADVHVVGEIVGASGFTQPMLFCRWQLLYEPSKSWQVLRGLQQVRRKGVGCGHGDYAAKARC